MNDYSNCDIYPKPDKPELASPFFHHPPFGIKQVNCQQRMAGVAYTAQ